MFVVYLPIICTAFHTLHGKMYFDSENEETIKRRCNPALSCFPSEFEWTRLEENMTGRLVWPDDRFNYTVIALESFKILNNLSPVYLNDLLTFKKHSYSFRYQKTVEAPQVRTVKHGSRSFRSTAAKI